MPVCGFRVLGTMSQTSRFGTRDPIILGGTPLNSEAFEMLAGSFSVFFFHARHGRLLEASLLSRLLAENALTERWHDGCQTVELSSQNWFCETPTRATEVVRNDETTIRHLQLKRVLRLCLNVFPGAGQTRLGAANQQPSSNERLMPCQNTSKNGVPLRT